jgi:hypothetical protein
MRYAVAAAAAAAVLLFSACTAPTDEDAEPSTGSSPSAAPSTATSSPPAPQPRPKVGECHGLTRAEALSPVVEGGSIPCARRHTSQTFHVGTLDLVRDGHLLAVDSAWARDQVSTQCPERLSRHVGGGREALRLSMVGAVWFTPSVESANAGADWFRCDVVAAEGGGDLLPLPRRTRGLLASAAGRDRFGMCGTAEPGTRGFTRVTCGSKHSWRAAATVDLPGGSYPSARRAGEVMESRCRSVARSLAEDPLDFRWSEERPTREQWQTGRRYGICWVPD